jgi:hypothetical protein
MFTIEERDEWETITVRVRREDYEMILDWIGDHWALTNWAGSPFLHAFALSEYPI